MSATSLLSACHHVTVPPGEEMHCLAPVTALCRLLLASTHWLVRHKALEAFKEFAQVLPHNTVDVPHHDSVWLLGQCSVCA